MVEIDIVEQTVKTQKCKSYSVYPKYNYIVVS